MKRFASIIFTLGLMIGLTGWFGNPQPAVAAGMTSLTAPSTFVLAATEGERRNTVEDTLKDSFGKKIDLNNSNVRVYALYPGMFPTLAGKILRATEREPFTSVDDVFEIDDLTERDIMLLNRYKDRFVVNPPTTAIVEGQDRFNNGIYDDVN